MSKDNPEQKIVFKCPRHGELDRTDVDVWCNRCERNDMVLKDGIFLCPNCFSNLEENFSCRICGKKVKMHQEKRKEKAKIKSAK